MRTCTHKARSRPNGYFLKIDNKKFYQIKVIVWSLGKKFIQKILVHFYRKTKSDQKPELCEHMGG